MGKHWIQFLVALLLLLPIAAGQEDESPEVQLRAAMHKELVEGDLSGAIELYQKVASNPNTARVTIARSLLQIGLCYEKLGEAQARPAYQKLIDGYPEQRREVEVARQRLAVMAKTSAAAAEMPTFQHIQITARLYGWASLSHQGDHLAFTAEQSLWILPVHGEADPEIAGVPQKLTEPVDAWGPIAWSRDGNWIAFNASSANVYVVSSEGGEPVRVVTNRFPGGIHTSEYYAISLSPDGTKLAYVAGPWGQEKMYIKPVTGGEAVPLPVGQARQPVFSPDGKWIACVTESRTQGIEDSEPKSTVRGALWVVSSDGKDMVLVTEFPGRASSPVWSPDSRMIAYLLDDGTIQNTQELRIIPIREDGRPAALPNKLELPFVTSQLAGWTARNEIGILKSAPRTSGIYKVAVAGGRAALIRAGEGDHPRWSPDGSRIYFRLQGRIAWIASGGGEPSDVPFRTAEVVEAVPGGSNEPSPDGSRLVFAGHLKIPGEVSMNIWTIPSNGGAPRQITDFQYPAGARFPCWAPDGKVIAFLKVALGEGANIYLVPAEGGNSRRITLPKDGVGWADIAWSPDGKNIAYFSRGHTIKLFNLRTGNFRILTKLQKLSQWNDEMAWSPDGKQLVYTNDGIIWRVPLDNPQPVRLETGRAELRATHIDWSPDGQWLVFKGVTGADLELHLMTDFMPLISR